MDNHHLNVKNSEETEYDKFQVSGDDTILEMTSHNPISHSTVMPNPPTSRKTSRRLRSLVWQYFWRIDETVNEKRVIQAICKYYEKILIGSSNGTSHLKRHVDKYTAKNLSNISTS